MTWFVLLVLLEHDPSVGGCRAWKSKALCSCRHDMGAMAPSNDPAILAQNQLWCWAIQLCLDFILQHLII